MTTQAAPQIGLKQFRQEGCLSYFLFDRKTRELIVIDPHLDFVQDYRTFIAENRLKPVWALDTHIHADHFSATHFLRDEYRAQIGMSSKTPSARPGRKLGHGDRIQAGALVLEVLETPGHTPDSVCYFGHGLVFTGDTLFIGSSGRTDFPGSDPSEQWRSIHQILGGLPGDSLVLPGHDYNGIIFSTIEVEKSRNSHWLLPTREAFVEHKNREAVPMAASIQDLAQGGLSPEIRERIQYNLSASPAAPLGAHTACATACGVAAAETSPVASINVQKYQHKLQEGNGVDSAFVDVREAEEYSSGHMPGTANIPLSELGLRLKELARSRKVYVSCLSGFRSTMAAKTLSYMGLPDVINVSGGFKAWQTAGLPIQKN